MTGCGLSYCASTVYFIHVFADTYMRTSNEWLLDPDLSNKGMKCTFNGEHKATRTSSNELTHQMLFGKGRNRKLVFV